MGENDQAAGQVADKDTQPTMSGEAPPNMLVEDKAAGQRNADQAFHLTMSKVEEAARLVIQSQIQSLFATPSLRNTVCGSLNNSSHRTTNIVTHMGEIGVKTHSV